MASPIRRIASGSIHHVISRGNNGGWIVRDAVDRSLFRLRLGDAARAFGWELVAWCLMTTHVHLVGRAPEGGISSGMQVLLSRHANAINRRYGRTGHLFQNRFYSVEVASDAHLISSIAYVNRNPVAAYAVEVAEDWRDSSYRATLGSEPAPGWLGVEEVLALFGPTPERARVNLADMVHNGRVPASEALEGVRAFESRGLATT
jgi:REP-associated tyrosine transposase